MKIVKAKDKYTRRDVYINADAIVSFMSTNADSNKVEDNNRRIVLSLVDERKIYGDKTFPSNTAEEIENQFRSFLLSETDSYWEL